MSLISFYIRISFKWRTGKKISFRNTKRECQWCSYFQLFHSAFPLRIFNCIFDDSNNNKPCVANDFIQFLSRAMEHNLVFRNQNPQRIFIHFLMFEWHLFENIQKNELSKDSICHLFSQYDANNILNDL